VEHLNAHGIAIEDGPKRRSGARGDAMSVYIRDPDGNKLELRTDVPILGRPGAQPLATATA
jgi:catechol 2,3-dioxygenase-like lactoylglutathione lyase family enzyme